LEETNVEDFGRNLLNFLDLSWQWGRLFFQKPFFQKFVVAPPPEVLGDERWNEGYPQTS